MSEIPFWDDNPKAWDHVLLFGAPFPGLAKISGSKGRKVDVKAGKGEDGGTLTDNGYDPAKGSIALRIVTREQWKAWQLAFPKLDPEKKERLPCDIQYPTLLAINIRRIYVTTIDVPQLEAGVLSVNMAWVQWFPEAKPTKGPATKKKVAPDLITGLGAEPFGPPPPPSTTPIGP